MVFVDQYFIFLGLRLCEYTIFHHNYGGGCDGISNWKVTLKAQEYVLLYLNFHLEIIKLCK